MYILDSKPSLLTAPPIDKLLDEGIKLVFLLPHQHMALPIPNPIRGTLTHLLANDFKMLESNHAIDGPMHDRNPVGADLVLDVQQLRLGLDVPPGRDGLQHEAFAGEALGVSAFFQLVGGKPVPVGRVVERWVRRRVLGVWQGKELVREEPLADLVQLRVDVPRHEHVDALSQVLDKGYRPHHPRERRYEYEARGGLRDQ